MNERYEGQVKWFDDVRGFGFITRNEVDYFVHYSSIMVDPSDRRPYRTLVDGERVEFELGTNSKGPCAVNVRAIDHHHNRPCTPTSLCLRPAGQTVLTPQPA